MLTLASHFQYYVILWATSYQINSLCQVEIKQTWRGIKFRWVWRINSCFTPIICLTWGRLCQVIYAVFCPTGTSWLWQAQARLLTDKGSCGYAVRLEDRFANVPSRKEYSESQIIASLPSLPMRWGLKPNQSVRTRFTGKQKDCYCKYKCNFVQKDIQYM